MVKLTFCLRRLAGLSREEFQKYWLEHHAPLVTKHAKTLRLRRYVQVHTSEDLLNRMLRESRKAPQPYDGVAELWWESKEELQEAISTPEGQRALEELKQDEDRFIDGTRSPIWLAIEHEIISP